MNKEKEYERICKKLGFIPSKYEPSPAESEQDDEAWVNPFLVLSNSEIMFLYENGYLRSE